MIKRLRVLIIGHRGQLGSDLWQVLSAHPDRYEIQGAGRQEMDITDVTQVRKVLHAFRPDVILNTAAFHDVPRCETEVEQAYQVNAMGALNVARVSAEIQAWNVYFSTDYVFSGYEGNRVRTEPYIEEDPPSPLNVYGTTKLAGEYHTLHSSAEGKGIVVRVSAIYGKIPSRIKGGNFVLNILHRLQTPGEPLRIVRDEYTSPTWTWWIARQIEWILRHGPPEGGVFHCACRGVVSWYEFARAIARLSRNVRRALIPISREEWDSPVRRPPFSALWNLHLEALGMNLMPSWEEALEWFFRREEM